MAIKNEIFERCHSAGNCKKEDPLGFLTFIVLQNIETNEGETLCWNPIKFQKKSHSAEKIRVKNTKGGILCLRGSGRRYFCFGRGSGVWYMFWT